MSGQDVVGGGAAQDTPVSVPTAAPVPAQTSSPPKRGFGARLVGLIGGLKDRFFKTVLVVTLIWYAIFNLPGFLNVLSAMRLKKHKKCIVRGYTKFLYFYPLIPISIICTLLHLAGAPSFPLAVTWILMIFVCALVAAEDIAGAAALGAMGFLVAIIGVYSALWIAGHDVNGWIKSFFHAFTPEFDPGMAMLLAALLSIAFVILYARVTVKSTIRVDNNTYNLKEIHQSTPYPSLEWRLRGEIIDWTEYFLMGAVSLKFLANLGAGRGRAASSGGVEGHQDDRVAASLANVPGGAIVDRLIWQAMASLNIERGSAN